MIFAPVDIRDMESLREMQPADWSDIVPFYMYYIQMPFCFPVKVLIDDTIAGIGTGIGLGETAWLAQIIVRPEFRKRGLGGAIVDHLLKILEGAGSRCVSLIATELGYPVYIRHGFTEESEYVFLKRTGPWPDFSRSGKIVPFSEEYAGDIFSLDRRATGEDRSMIISGSFRSGHVCLCDEKVAGYYLPDLGEGLIIAEDMEAGFELLKLRSLHTERTVLPAANRRGISCLKYNGFSETGRAKRMTYGASFRWHPEMVFSRVGGNLG
jgi:GNAT superfamily N-acetyltransferase